MTRDAHCIATPLFNRETKPASDGSFAMPADGWFHLASLGEHHHSESGLTQVLDAEACAAMANSFQPGEELLIDFEHESHDGAKRTEAAGWITALQNRDDGLWMQVRWSKLGADAVRHGVYRYISPVWLNRDCEDLGSDRIRPRRLSDAGLTNRPNLKGLNPLSNRSESGASTNTNTDTMKNLNKKLGLSPEAAEDAAIAEVDKLVNRATDAEAAAKKAKDDLTALQNNHRTLLEAQAESDLDAAGVQGDDRAPLKEQLLANREGTLKVLAIAVKNSGTKKAEALTNRAAAKTPADVKQPGAKTDQAPLLNRQQAAIAAERRAGARSNEDAYRAAKAKDPALFAPQAEE